ncbi:hypothetical protein [Caviibacter abscessus]|uniref:hypothetical protein n=1 Tax=Caviibacter abscessus TaxID=1766719 RepID=UPI000830AAC9|nr:hypothetical protein [Caviibacter abscessus]
MTKSNDIMIVIYKKPFSDYILGIIDANKLYNSKKLLLNLEKVLPISKILKGRKNKLINNIDYEKKDEKLIFHLYF